MSIWVVIAIALALFMLALLGRLALLRWRLGSWGGRIGAVRMACIALLIPLLIAVEVAREAGLEVPGFSFVPSILFWGYFGLFPVEMAAYSVERRREKRRASAEPAPPRDPEPSREGPAYPDPGWGPAIRDSVLLLGVVRFALRGERAWRELDGISAIRAILVMFVQFPLLASVALVMMDEDPWRWDPVGLVAVACAAIAAWRVWALRQRIPAPTERTGVGGTYRGMVMTGMAWASASFVASIVVSFVTVQDWVILLGLITTLALLAAIAPTKRELDRRQARLDRARIPVSLRAALMVRPVTTS